MTKDRLNRIPSHLRPFLEVKYCELPTKYDFVFNALIEAIEAIDGKLRIEKKYQIILGESPFELRIEPCGVLNYTIDNGTVCSVFENMIFLDCLKLSCRPLHEKVAIILEEFVHCLMNVADEPLTKEIVCCLYPHVSWDGTRYVAHQAPSN